MRLNFCWIITSLLCIFAIIQNIKLRKLSEKLDTMNKLKKQVFNLCDEVSNANNKAEVYNYILNASINLIGGSDKGSILILEDDGFFYYKALRGFSEDIKALRYTMEECFLYKINSFKKTAIINNPKKFDETMIDKEKIDLLKKSDALEMNSTLATPIHINGKLIGVINIDSCNTNTSFNEDDIETMDYIKHELELALKNFFVQDQLRKAANRDELTGIYNRRGFKALLSEELKAMKLNKKDSCVVLIDLDDFKSINDNYGHNEGDKVLIKFSGILKENIGDKDICARMAGDEFVVIFKNSDEKAAHIKMELIREKFSEYKVGNIRLNFSYGVSLIKLDGEFTKEHILSKADKRMYEDKKNKYCKR